MADGSRFCPAFGSRIAEKEKASGAQTRSSHRAHEGRSLTPPCTGPPEGFPAQFAPDPEIRRCHADSEEPSWPAPTQVTNRTLHLQGDSAFDRHPEALRPGPVPKSRYRPAPAPEEPSRPARCLAARCGNWRFPERGASRNSKAPQHENFL